MWSKIKYLKAVFFFVNKYIVNLVNIGTDNSFYNKYLYLGTYRYHQNIIIYLVENFKLELNTQIYQSVNEKFIK